MAALISVPAHVGYPLLFLLVASETAGLLVPGETALIAASVLAARGDLSLGPVIAVAAAGAIVGDNFGYFIGGRGILRWLLTRPGRLHAARARLVVEGERFFRRHGAKAVFFARWLPGLRLTGGWFAGANRMPWRSFAVWNAAGGIAWAASVGVAAFLLGDAAARVFGTGGAVVVAVAVITGIALLLRRRASV